MWELNIRILNWSLVGDDDHKDHLELIRVLFRVVLISFDHHLCADTNLFFKSENLELTLMWNKSNKFWKQ